MKRFYISIILVVVALSLCVIGAFTVSKMVDEIMADVAFLQHSAKTENFKAARDISLNLANKWDKYQNYLIVFVNMARIDELSEKMFSVKDYCTKESLDHLNATLSEIEFLILDIKDAEIFSLFSFL